MAEQQQTFGFLSDLDEYFCENYANYDKLCVLDGYKVPKMQATERREDGRLYSYTLPANTMRLAKQEKCEELLALLKTKIADKSFSFSFEPASIMQRIKKNGKYSFKLALEEVFRKNSVDPKELIKELSIDEEIWTKICKGDYLPSKNAIFSICLVVRASYEDTAYLLGMRYMEFDYTLEREVVISYLFKQKVFNPEMVKSAFQEYKVGNLFIKWLEE